jgi:hypothetical protein
VFPCTDHIIINKRTSFLNEASNSKCQIFCRSLFNSSTKFCKPVISIYYRNIKDHVSDILVVK